MSLPDPRPVEPVDEVTVAVVVTGVSQYLVDQYKEA